MLRTGPLLQYRNPEEMTVSDVPASWGAGLGAVFSNSFLGSFGPLAYRAVRRGSMEPGGFAGTMLDDEARQRIAEAQGIKMLSAAEANDLYGLGDLVFESPISEAAAKDLNEIHKEMLRREDIARRAQLGGFEQFIAGLGGAALDPVNIAAAYFPASLIGWTAKGTSIGARATFGAAEGAIGGIPVAAGTYALSKGEQRPYSLADAFLDVTFGTLLGAGLHVGIGAFKDWRKRGTPLPALEAALQGLQPQQRVELLRGAVADVLEGRPVGVGPLIELAVREHVAGEFLRLRMAGERIGAEETTALAKLLKIEEPGLIEIETLNRRIAELEAERADVAARRAAIGEELAPDTATAARLAEIDQELAGAVPAKRRSDLVAEKRLLTEGAKPEDNLERLRALSEDRGLRVADARARLRLEATRKKQDSVEQSVAAARREFKQLSGRTASRASTVRALAERALRRAAADVKAKVSPAEIAAAAERIMRATPADFRKAIDAEIAAFAQKSYVALSDTSSAAVLSLAKATGLTEREIAAAYRVNPRLVERLQDRVAKLIALLDSKPASISSSDGIRTDLRATEEGRALIEEIQALLDRLAPGRAKRGEEFGTADDTADLRVDPETEAALPVEDRGKVVVGGRTIDRGAMGVIIRIAADVPVNSDVKQWYHHIARHEVVHALRRLGLFTAREWDALLSAASRNGWARKIDSAAIRGADSRLQAEEAIAEAFAIWARGRLPESELTAKERSLIERVFGRVTQFVKRVASYISGKDISPREWERIFTAIENGEIGSRNLDLVQTKKSLTPLGFTKTEKVFPDANALVRSEESALRAEIAQLAADVRALAQTASGAPSGAPALNAKSEEDAGGTGSENATPAAVAGQGTKAAVAARQTQPYYDQADVATSREISETIEATPSFRKREPDEGIGTTTQAAEEAKALDAETAAEVAELKKIGQWDEADEAAMTEASEEVTAAQTRARVRDMAAMCLMGAAP